MPNAKGSVPIGTSGAVGQSLTEVVGQLLMLDVIASSAAVRLLRRHDGQEKAGLTAQILNNIEITCRKKGLLLREIMDAQEYAKKLLYNAQAEADRLDDIKHGYLNQKKG